jgi:hypothetical protein
MAIIRTIGQTTEPQSIGEAPNGVGYAPVGSVLAWFGGYFAAANNAGYNLIFGSADSVTGANDYLIPMGWRVCDGGEPEDAVSPIWNTSGRKVPQINDRRFLQGSLSIVASGEGTLNPDGTIQGASNTIPDHIHAVSFTSQAESGHTHTLGGSTSAGTQHSHNWPPPATNQDGNWSTDSSNSVATSGGYGDGSKNTYSDNAGIGAWSLSGTSRSSSYSQQSLNHSHSVRTDSFAGDLPVGMGQSGPDGAYYMIADSGISDQGALYAAATDLTNHSHEFYLYAHRHWITTRAATEEAAHTHPLPANTGATSGHTHTISGNAGTGQIPSATENRPQYLRCFMIIRYK